MSIKAAAEDVQVANNGAVGAAAASNMLDFEELSDIVRCGGAPRLELQGPAGARCLIWAVWLRGRPPGAAGGLGELSTAPAAA